MAATDITTPHFADYVEPEPKFTLLSDPSRYISSKFRLVNTNVTIANTLRRAILTQTPSVGFRTEPYDKSDVVISINTTPLVNEMIAHRIGMIPINADPAKFDPDLVEFELDVKNETKEIIDVRASDIKAFARNPETFERILMTDTFFPPDPVSGQTILITRLRPQWNPSAQPEHIHLKAKASISTGSENIRWSPVSQASYEYTRDTNEANIEIVFNEWLRIHKKIETPETDPRRDELRREFDTMEIQRCYVKDRYGNPSDFTFHLESVGIQDNRNIVKSALSSCIALVEKYRDIDTRIPTNVRIQTGDSRFNSIEFVFQNESHTLGNLLETKLVEYITAASNNITYAGYKVPHPLRPEMFVRIGIRDDIDIDDKQQTARTVLANACRDLMEEFKDLSTSWNELMSLSGGAAPAASLREYRVLPSGGVIESKGPE